MALRPSHFLPGLALPLALACTTGAARGAEFGEARVLSHIGQPLVADVELTLIEHPAQPVGVRLADPNVYRGANIAMPAVLNGLGMSVTRRDGRQFVRLTSSKPVDSRHLHVYAELSDGAQRSVRLVTLWLTPDPNPAPPPPSPPPLPLASAAPAAQAAQAIAPVPAPGVATAAPPAVRKAARPANPAPERERPRPAKREREAPPAPVAPVAPIAPTAPPACAAASAAVDACTVLGAKNAELRAALDRIEDKVGVLQAAATGGGTAEAAAQPPREAPRIQLKPKKAAPAAQAGTETSWLPLAGSGAAILALGALVAVVLRRRRRAAAGGAADEGAGQPGAKPGLMAAVKARLLAGRKNTVSEAPAAPSPGAAEPVAAAQE